MGRRKLFCEYGKVCYQISLAKEYLLRDFRDLTAHKRFAVQHSTLLPETIKGHRSLLVRRLHGVDLQLQYQKVENLRLAAQAVDGLIIAPGETFSFWKTVGKPSAGRGYQAGLIISADGSFHSGVGGGLCQLANLVHWLILNSPLTVSELHHHSDALFPDTQRRIPFGTGTSVFYKNVDYRFYNNTDQPVQLHVWLEEEDLCGELRAKHRFDCRYKIIEENHHFAKEGDEYYRISQIYRQKIDRETGLEIERQLVLDNHSRVLYDPSLIPTEELRT